MAANPATAEAPAAQPSTYRKLHTARRRRSTARKRQSVRSRSRFFRAAEHRATDDEARANQPGDAECFAEEKRGERRRPERLR